MTTSEDIFEPNMPDVEMLPDIDGLFAAARAQARDQTRQLIIVTPGRMRLAVPAPTPGSMPSDAGRFAKSVLGDRPVDVSIIGYTKLDALMHDRESNISSMNQCIPFFGHLLAFAYSGHSVVIFEGHRSALEAGLRDADVLIIDEAMLPFLQEDWALVAFGAMRPGARVFVHSRESYSLLPVARAPSEPDGWRYSEPDGEASYANCLLTTMAKAPRRSVRIVAGSPLPDLATIATDPGALEWIATLPFKYDRLDAEQIIEILVGLAKPVRLGIFKRAMVLSARLVLSGDEARDVAFTLTPGSSDDGRRQLDIESK